MKNTEQLREDAKASSELLTRTTRLEDVERVLKKGCIDLALDIPQLRNTVVVNHDLLVQALIQWANSERAELRELGVEVSRDDHYPHVTYTGQRSSTDGTKMSEVEFPAGLVPAVSVSLSEIKAHNGSWILRKDGTLVMTVTNRAEDPFAIIDGQVFITQADLQKHYIKALGMKNYSVKVALDDNGRAYAAGVTMAEPVESPEQILQRRVTQLETVMAGLQGQLTMASAHAQEPHWNKPEDLPPVGCDLLIKVPAGTSVTTLDHAMCKMTYDTEVEQVFKVFRTSHLADRAGDMEYRLPDNSTVTGRFPWTYP